jgi:putative addiction module component (TIGR02574 family)
MGVETTSIFELSPAEKLQLVEDLWDELAADPAAVPVHPWQIEELDRRRSNLMNNPASALSWEQAKRLVRGANGV